jgi:hypothetical protein
VPGTPTLFRPSLCRLSWRGLGYGGGLLDRAASQSKGVEDATEGVDAGERTTPIETRGRGVFGDVVATNGAESGDVGLAAAEGRGVAVTEAAFDWARRLRDIGRYRGKQEI